MKTIRKIEALALAAAMLLSLASCGSPQSNNNTAKTEPNGRYVLDSGEAVIDDVNFSDYSQVDDNAAVFYEIFVGSFSDSDGDGTGDLRGIIDRLDYLNDGDPKNGKSLGIEGIWLTPIFRSRTYHKYDVMNYYEIDPSFGSMDDLKELIEACHSRGIKLILDLVINHTSTGNEWYKKFAAAHRNNDTSDPYYDFYSYYTAGESPEPGKQYAQAAGTNIYYECNFDGGMPELNYDNFAVREAVRDVAEYYIKMGVDGFRFDAAKYIYFGNNQKNVDFWRWFISELKTINPNLYTVAEVWDSDSITDQYFKIINCFNFTTSQPSGMIADTAKEGDVNRFTAYVQSYIDKVKSLNKDAMIIEFISNHDMDRSAGYLTGISFNRQFAANLYILGPGSPFIYYGEEIGLKGSRGGANTDANRRLAMIWGDDDKVSDPEGTTYSKDSQVKESVAEQLSKDDSLLTYYKRLLMIRAANPEIARGEYKALKIEGTRVGGFISTFEGSSVCVIHNPLEDAKTIDLSEIRDAAGFTSIADACGKGTASIEGTKLTIDGKTSVVLRIPEAVSGK